MSSAVQTTPTPTEARAKRTHARRSCDVCKVRKTRCELPDLDVPSGPNPLPTDKACHRCRVLALPCIVDDSGKKSRKRTRDDSNSKQTDLPGTSNALTSNEVGQSTPKTGNTSKRRSTKGNNRNEGPSTNTLQAQQTNSKPLARRQSILNHSLDVLHGISPLPNSQQPASLDEATRIPSEIPLYETNDTADQSRSMKLHGRPAELACAMLKVAYGKTTVKRRPDRDEEDINLNEVVDEPMRARLQHGFTQLKTFHPHLDTFDQVYTTYNNSPDFAVSLLLSVLLYLSSLSLQSDEPVQHLRTTLTPYISYLRDRVLLQLTRSFAALQALDLLSVHAPLGVLPLQPTSLKDLAVARGMTLSGKCLMETLEFSRLIDQIMIGPGLVFAFECTDFWLWCSLIADQASITFEDFEPLKPSKLNEARRITENIMNYKERSDVWQDGISQGDIAVLVGRLSICDKLARFEEMLDTMSRIRGTLDISSRNSNFDPVRAILNEFESFERRMEDVDRRHDTIMGILVEHSQGVESGWLSYRPIRRRYETGKIYVTGLRMLMATHYLPGCLYAYEGLPPGLMPPQAVSYAISRAHNPSDIVKFITDTTPPKPAVEAVWDWGRRRGVNTEACLVNCAELGQTLVNDLLSTSTTASSSNSTTTIVPLHEVICIANEAAKVLIEMEAGTIQILRSTNQIHKAFRERSWLVVMNQVSQILRSIGMLAPPIDNENSQGDSLANGCSNLIGSMVRSAEEWTKSLEKEIPIDPQIQDHPSHSHSHQHHQQPDDDSNLPPHLLNSNGSNNNLNNGNNHNHGYSQSPNDQQQTPSHPPPPNLHESLRQSSSAGLASGHHQYMDSSDRWMASESTESSSQHPPPPPQSAPAGHAHPSQQLQHSVMTDQRHQQNYHHPPYPNNGDGHHPGPPQSGPYPNTALDQLLSEMFCYNLPSQQARPGHITQQQQHHHTQEHHHHQQIQGSWPQDMRS
ncbi:uncharacterized protein L201_007889 [Kwoniella dendrophila CBS 6074]|uniref:Zn(2)-C6 fungal-type domain-containing protein n=1 Tax=Kwoniella dendrophila CBS 6074 TaxID=1295534 RepID=A0AAX4K5D0_9TREE